MYGGIPYDIRFEKDGFVNNCCEPECGCGSGWRGSVPTPAVYFV